VVIRNAAAVILAYVLGLHESSVILLLAENITHTAAKITVRQVLVKVKHYGTRRTYVRTDFAFSPSPIDLLQKWKAQLPEHALLSGFPGDGSERQPGSLSGFHSAACMQYHVFHYQARHGLRNLCKSELAWNRRYKDCLWRCAKLDLAWARTAMTKLVCILREIILTPASCWIFGPAMAVIQ
jgi:hypothetical protein